MLKVFNGWIERYFSDEEALLLFLFLVISLAIVLTLGGTLAPVFAGMIFAFLMQGGVRQLKDIGLGHTLSVSIVFVCFLSLLMGFLLFVIPIAWRQLANVLNELPKMMAQGQELLLLLPDQYPELVTEDQVRTLIHQAGVELGKMGQNMLSYSLSSINNLIQLLIYLVLVPILVFFFMKDGALIAKWWTSFLPERRQMMRKIWVEMDDQIANYVRGKAIEIAVVGVVSYVAFIILGLNYAALLALMVGLSVVIPYIGAAVVTLPVAVIAFFQWGWSNEFLYLMAAYGIIQALDGNVLVPLLFSEAVNLHPVAVIVAVLVFGGIWGFWGVFFAIPLATLVKAIITAWPKKMDVVRESAAAPR